MYIFTRVVSSWVPGSTGKNKAFAPLVSPIKRVPSRTGTLTLPPTAWLRNTQMAACPGSGREASAWGGTSSRIRYWIPNKASPHLCRRYSR